MSWMEATTRIELVYTVLQLDEFGVFLSAPVTFSLISLTFFSGRRSSRPSLSFLVFFSSLAKR